MTPQPDLDAEIAALQRKCESAVRYCAGGAITSAYREAHDALFDALTLLRRLQKQAVDAKDAARYRTVRSCLPAVVIGGICAIVESATGIAVEIPPITDASVDESVDGLAAAIAQEKPNG